MREGVAYRIVGGVRFYERKEIKDSLAYLKLIVNPYDDVSMRRVINVPARGIGKGVMDALERRCRHSTATRRRCSQPASSRGRRRIAMGAARARDRRARVLPAARSHR